MVAKVRCVLRNDSLKKLLDISDLGSTQLRFSANIEGLGQNLCFAREHWQDAPRDQN